MNLYEILPAQPEPEAHRIALASELFIKGSLDIFAKPTNLNTENRIPSFDTSDLGTQLRPFGMLALMESMMNRVMDNRKQGRRTWLYFDELSVLFSYEWFTSFLDVSWKRYKKYGALATGIFQNLGQALKSEKAKSIISNSEFLLLMNQAAPDWEQEESPNAEAASRVEASVKGAASGTGRTVKYGSGKVLKQRGFPNGRGEQDNSFPTGYSETTRQAAIQSWRKKPSVLRRKPDGLLRRGSSAPGRRPYRPEQLDRRCGNIRGQVHSGRRNQHGCGDDGHQTGGPDEECLLGYGPAEPLD
ncbi:hypothetical protein [Anaerotruncus sp. AF02-27]|uniref:hypothetical protein n=1 Tax=Anaerotruncus sp. AF02-27 TaxID=2292191 RepID=UPI0011C2140C|nr:hypothetical protein [Anaerotruncus sp. AF02-27]